jgi:hypothetical protein
LSPAGGSVEHTENWYLFKAVVGDKEAEIDAQLLPLVEKAG